MARPNTSGGNASGSTSSPTADTAAGSTATGPTAADFLARNRGGGLFTEAFSQRAGALLSVAAYRLGLAPTVLSLGNLVLGLAASIIVIVFAAPGSERHVIVGLGALLLWHLAYALDCADGQLARVTGRTSPEGKRIDILCDVAIQIALVASVVAVASAYDDNLPAWLGAAFAGTWMVNLVTSVLQQGSAAHSLVASSSPLVRAVKLVRDYGAVVTVIGLTIALIPQWTVWLLITFTIVNGVFLFASIAATARASLGRS
jgi:phosphatidylglycerophosphate synthase